MLQRVDRYLDNIGMLITQLHFVLFIAEDTRQLCVDAGLIPSIMTCIETQHHAVVLQSFRAMGNIACDNSKIDNIFE